MKTRDMVLVGIGAGVGALLLWFFFGPRADEPGIRVKNGSVFIETASGVGFNQQGQDFVSKRDAKNCFKVQVMTTQTCTGTNPISNAKVVSFYTLDDTNTRHQVVTAGGKFRLILAKSWNFEPSTDQNHVQYPNSVTKLARVTVQAGAQSLNCTIGGDLTKDMILIDNVC